MPSTIIIGAGMAGLAAAHELRRNNQTVTVLDKGRGVGGRLATRRLAMGRADHGAQFFSARTPDFQAHVQQLMKAGVVREWNLQEAEIIDTSFRHPRYIGAEGMNAIAKYMAKSVPVQTGERAVRINAIANGCQVVTESGNTYEAEQLLITIPVPQAEALLSDSGLEPGSLEIRAFSNIRYQPCIAVMAVLNGNSNIPAPGILRFDENADTGVAWVADNRQKGISPDQTTITVHATHAFSQLHLEDDLNVVGKTLLDQLTEWIPAGSVTSYQVHRWRYSLANQRHDEAFVVGKAPFMLLFGGDGFGMGNVEGAFQSGLQMARFLLGRGLRA